jgi:hypothetical protein
MSTTYGTGTAMQFTDATQRQVLELGSKIHYYNPNVTPIFSLFGMKSMVTPVPIFEWMEDEYMIKKSEKFNITSTDVADTATGGINGHHTILIAERQAQMEMFEVGGIYSASVAGGSAALQTAVTHFICIAVGKNVNHGSATDKMVQFLGAHAHGSLDAYNVEACADGSDLITADASGVLTLEYVANAGLFYDNGTATAYYGYQTHSGTNGFGEITFADADYFMRENGVAGIAEGSAVGSETRKQVRRLKNCTQIFREPYTITNTAKASKHYGGSEMSRLQARKLAKIKGDIEWAILTNGAISLDASAENPKRTFQGLGLGASTGSITSLNGYDNTNLQWDYDATNPLNGLDGVCEYIFSDMVSGGMKKTVFASNKWLVHLASATRLQDNAFYDSGEETKSGLRVRSYMGPVGQLDFVAHPYLKGAYEDYAVAIDPANFSVRPLAGRDMQLRKDIVKDGRDGQTDEWLMETGIEVRNEQTHAIMKLV